MKIKITTKYKIGQSVWTVIEEDMEVWKWQIASVIYYGGDNYEYEIEDCGCYTTMPEELIYRTRKEAKAVLDKWLQERYRNKN